MLSLCLWASTLYSNCDDPRNFTHETFEFLESIHRSHIQEVWDKNRLARVHDNLTLAREYLIQTRRLAAKGYATRAQILSDELVVEKIELQVADLKDRMLSLELGRQTNEINYRDSCKNSYKTPVKDLLTMTLNNQQRWDSSLKTYSRRINIAKKETKGNLEIVKHFEMLFSRGYSSNRELKTHRFNYEASKRNLAGLIQVQGLIQSYVEGYHEMAEGLRKSTDSHF